MSRNTSYLIFLTALALIALITTTILSCLDSTIAGWPSLRLAPAAALARGLPVYPEPDGYVGAMTLYGPLLAIAYLPAAIWSNVNFCLILSSLLTGIITIAPTTFFLQKINNSNKLLKASTIGLFILAVCTMESTRYSLFHAHADAPGIVLVTIGFFLLCLISPKNNVGLGIAATALSLSVFGKQTLILAVVGAWLFVLILNGLQYSLKFLLFYSSSLVFFILIFGVWFGFETLLMHGIEIPSNHEWQLLEYHVVTSFRGKLVSTVAESINLLAKYGAYLIPTIVLFIDHVIVKKSNFREEMLKNKAEKCVFCSVLFSFSLLPASAVGVAKKGGWINSESLFCIFLAIGFSLSLPILVANFKKIQLQKIVVLTVAGVLFVSSISQTIRSTVRYQSFGVFLEQGDAQKLLQEAEENKYFFPSDPLVHIIEEKRLLPNTDVVDSINLARKQQNRENNFKYEEVQILPDLIEPEPEFIVYAGLDAPRLQALGYNDSLVPIKKLRKNNEFSFIIHSVDYSNKK